MVVVSEHLSGSVRMGRVPAALTGFVGQPGKIQSIRDLIATARLVSLTGPGGGGKTRLAIEVAGSLEHKFPGAVCWVDLASLADSSGVARALANALGVREEPGRALLGSVIAHVADARRILVLDNCEHLLPDVAESIRTLLSECPGLRVLATSREMLGVAGELVWQVPTLSVPSADDALSQEKLLDYESVQLFRERAQAVQAGFTVDERNAPAIARICRGLDGLPLAIELAAARVRVLSVLEIAEALEDRLALLTAAGYTAVDRHRSLRAVLDWSYRLLTEPERRLFAQLSVFKGTFSLDAARAVHDKGYGESDPLELLAHLVDRSLIVASSEGRRARYTLSETVRLYTDEHLRRSGEDVATQLRLVSWCAAFTERAEPELFGPDQTQWLDQLELERGNLSAAVHICVREKAAASDGLRITAALWRFCYLRGYYTEGRSWSNTMLASASAENTPAPVRARALVGAGNLAYLQCAYDEATEQLEKALAIYRDLSDTPGVAKVLQSLGSVARERGRYEVASALHTETLTLWRRLNHVEGAARAINSLSLLAWLQEDLSSAAALAEQALGQYRVIGDSEGIVWSLINLAASAVYGGDSDQAEQVLRESLSRSRAIGYREGVAWSLNLLGILALQKHDVRAARTRVVARQPARALGTWRSVAHVQRARGDGSSGRRRRANRSWRAHARCCGGDACGRRRPRAAGRTDDDRADRRPRRHRPRC